MVNVIFVNNFVMEYLYFVIKQFYQVHSEFSIHLFSNNTALQVGSIMQLTCVMQLRKTVIMMQ